MRQLHISHLTNQYSALLNTRQIPQLTASIPTIGSLTMLHWCLSSLKPSTIQFTIFDIALGIRKRRTLPITPMRMQYAISIYDKAPRLPISAPSIQKTGGTAKATEQVNTILLTPSDRGCLDFMVNLLSIKNKLPFGKVGKNSSGVYQLSMLV